MKRPLIIILLLWALVGTSCNSLDDDRIYSSCRIDLSIMGNWTIYGVNGLGTYRYFSKSQGIPGNFPYTATTYTGFGGVLLMDVGVGATQPAAYEMTCPVERKRSVTVAIDDGNLDAVCPECGSRFNVLTGYGQAVKGPAFDRHFSLHRYVCMPSANGGYIITN